MRKWMRLVAALGVAACGVSLVQAADGPTVYGKQLVQVSSVPADAMARFAAHDAMLKAKGDKPGVLAGGSEDWNAPEFAATSSGNPYRVVIRVAGTVMTDGDAGSIWMAGWNEGGQTRIFPVTGATKPAAKAGERVELVGASSPVSFKADGTRVAAVSFMGTRNLRVDDVKVEVWSGVGKSSFVERVWAWSPLLVGVVFLGLFFWFRRG